jgi:hypothetical protein
MSFQQTFQQRVENSDLSRVSGFMQMRKLEKATEYNKKAKRQMPQIKSML